MGANEKHASKKKTTTTSASSGWSVRDSSTGRFTDVRASEPKAHEASPSVSDTAPHERRRPGRLSGRFVVGSDFFEPMSADDLREFFGERDFSSTRMLCSGG